MFEFLASTWAALRKGSVFTVLLAGHTPDRAAGRADHLPGRRAEEAHQGLTREDRSNQTVITGGTVTL